ncbi:MAG: hypothetical protein ACLR8Y_20080 [Alistipes indistinctus]
MKAYTRTQVARGFFRCGNHPVTAANYYYYRACPDLTHEERPEAQLRSSAFASRTETYLMIRADQNVAGRELPVERPVYSFVEHNRLPETVRVIPSKY